jgi:hypothetical protein
VRVGRPNGTLSNITTLRILPFVTPRFAGEHAMATVVLPEGTPSNEIEIVLDTLQPVTGGDSVAWGLGLPEQQKFDRLVRLPAEVEDAGRMLFGPALLSWPARSLGSERLKGQAILEEVDMRGSSVSCHPEHRAARQAGVHPGRGSVKAPSLGGTLAVPAAIAEVGESGAPFSGILRRLYPQQQHADGLLLRRV